MVDKFTKPPYGEKLIEKINDIIDNKQDVLVSGTNIKTINNTSLLGSGNIDIQGGGTITVDDELSTTSENPVQNKVITTKLNKKIEGISSSDVTTALGYTPYNATNPNGYTSNVGTITGIKMNGSSKGTSGVVDLGTVITAHQDISGKQDKITSTNKLSADLLSEGTTNKLVSATEKSTWNGKQNALTTTQINNIAKGGTALQPNDDISELNNDAGYITGINSGDVKAALRYIPESSSNKVTSLSSSSTDTQYPSAKCVYDALQNAGGGTSRNIGEIVTSTIPLTDAGLHLLDGALIQGSGVYSAFVTYIAGLRTQYSSLFTTESDWQSTVTQYGVCGKFVYNSTNNTVRLPKYSDKIYTQELNTTAPVIGNGLSLGLTNGAVNAGAVYLTNTVTRVTGDTNSYGHTVATSVSNTNNPFGSSSIIGVSKDPKKSGLIAQLSNITTSLDGYYYIVIVTSTKTDIQVDIDNIATDLNGKADIDLTNTTNQAKILMSGMGMPSSTYVDLTLGASGATYTAPANGWFSFSKQTNGTNQYLSIKTDLLGTEVKAPSSGSGLTTFIPVRKGDVITVWYNAGGTTNYFKFIYAKGSESEA